MSPKTATTLYEALVSHPGRVNALGGCILTPEMVEECLRGVALTSTQVELLRETLEKLEVLKTQKDGNVFVCGRQEFAGALAGLAPPSPEEEEAKEEARQKEPEEEGKPAEVVPTPPAPDMRKPLFDAPGEYYQMLVQGVGMVIVRSESEPRVWGSTTSHKKHWWSKRRTPVVQQNLLCDNGFLFFDDFWFLQDEPPLRREMQHRKTGQMVMVEVPRLRYWKATRGAYVTPDTISFVARMNRDSDPVLHHLMRQEASIVTLDKPDQAGGELQ